MSILTDFVNKYMPDALRTSAVTGLNPDVILAQAALESNYGRSAPNNNLFGIKGPGGAQTTQEFIGGIWQTVTASFKGFASTSASFDGYASFINGRRYSAANDTKDSNLQIQTIAGAGYATDPNYASKVQNIAGQIRATGLTASTLTTDGTGYGRDALKALLGDKIGNQVSDSLGGDGLGGVLTDTSKALTPDFSAWFQRIAMGAFALIFIAAALFAFKSSDALNSIGNARKALS
jgi:hypothetical protein